jgi:hypothetical protein
MMKVTAGHRLEPSELEEVRNPAILAESSCLRQGGLGDPDGLPSVPLRFRDSSIEAKTIPSERRVLETLAQRMRSGSILLGSREITEIDQDAPEGDEARRFHLGAELTPDQE